MVKVGHDGAFSVNGVGLKGTPFPLSFSVHENGGSWTIDATAAQALELVDVLTRVANDTLVVVDLATNSFLDEELGSWRPSRIAAAQGVDCRVHHLGTLATGVIGLSEELLVIRRDDLGPFLAGWSPYELTVIDVPCIPSPDQLDEIALTIGTNPHDAPVLPTLPGSRLWFCGHDDCYATLESTDPAMPVSILSRLLALLAGSALTGVTLVDVPEPDRTTVGRLIEQSPHWVGVLGVTSEDSVTIHLSATVQRWRLGERLPAYIDHNMVYDVTHHLWR